MANTEASDQARPASGLSADEVRHIATLARIGMTEAEVEKFRAELSSILAHFDSLAAIDTDGVEPTMNGADLLNVMADDEARDSLPADDVLANAPLREDTLFRVRGVLD